MSREIGETMETKEKMLVRGAMLLAIGLLAQQLRLILPLPRFVTTLIIGTLVNAALVIAARHAGLFVSTVIAILLPLVAFFQGQLLLAFLIPVVAFGNIVLVVLCNRWWSTPIFAIAPIAKTFTLYALATLVLMTFDFPENIMRGVLVGMGWPQLITAVLGVILAIIVDKRLEIS